MSRVYKSRCQYKKPRDRPLQRSKPGVTCMETKYIVRLTWMASGVAMGPMTRLTVATSSFFRLSGGGYSEPYTRRCERCQLTNCDHAMGRMLHCELDVLHTSDSTHTVSLEGLNSYDLENFHTTASDAGKGHLARVMCNLMPWVFILGGKDSEGCSLP